MNIYIKNLVKQFSKRIVVNDVSLTVSQGEIIGLLGPNGAGKSTIFYMIVGILRPDSGTIYIDDKNITDFPIYKRSRLGIGYLPQEMSIFRKMTTSDNIIAALELKYKDNNTINNRLEELISDFNLQKVAKSYGYALSGGERRRVEIARCLAIDPLFILLDEPFAGIDPISVYDIQEMICSLKNRGIGVLITDHNVRETLKIADKGYIISDGKVLVEGSAEEILNNNEVKNKYLGKGFTL